MLLHFWNLMFENDTNCARITIKTYCVKVSHVCNQLLISSQNLLKICSFNLITSSQMCVPLVNCWESSLSFSRTALSRIEAATWSDFWSRQHHNSYHQIKWTRHQLSGLHYMWHRPTACLCVHNVNELKQHL